MKKRKVRAADLFCGAGGTSTGLVMACKELDVELELLAINHWDIAIETHQSNHPFADHRCESLDNVNPREAVRGDRLNLLWASPECTHHANARGGRPMNDQSRSSAWHIPRWAEALYIDTILIENVREFSTWGPIGVNGRPMKKYRGQTFMAFCDSLKSLGYNVDCRVLNAANYGDPTTRERLFIQARRGGKPISWPEPTHTSGAVDTLFETLRPWKPARGIIDWSIESQSIFKRKRPLADKTLARIAAGARKFWGVDLEPFLVVLRNHGDARSIDDPVPTLTANGQHFGLCEPLILGQQSGAKGRPVSRPMPTIATGGAIGLIEPFILNLDHRGGNGQQVRSVDRPVPTQTTKARTCLVEPFLITAGGPEGQGRNPRSLDDPLGTVLTENHSALIEPFFFAHQRRENAPQSVDEPMQTLTASSSDFALVEPFLVKFNSTGKANSISKPIDTVTTKDRFGLVELGDGRYLDIRFRMLQPHELSRAMSFPDDYKFSGNREAKVKQIGNAVPVNIARALCMEVLS